MLETLPHRADTKLVPVLLLIAIVTLASHFTSLGLELALPHISQVLLGLLLHSGFSFSAPITLLPAEQPSSPLGIGRTALSPDWRPTVERAPVVGPVQAGSSSGQSACDVMTD